ncbi:MAG: excinuclease ABC subunit UvrA [Treponema sp.]|nr:excinuclease ABC subunit UvrA [Treponema sp.]
MLHNFYINEISYSGVTKMPEKIEIHGARVHNLKNINVSVPLGKFVAVAGVSGSGKSSLALGVLYAEGSRRYLEALSAYTRRRLTQAENADIDSIENVPAALALHQRPSVPTVRSTFGTLTELTNSLRLMYSRLGCHRCPNGHLLAPTADVAMGKQLICPECGISFDAPSAERFSFNSSGACPTCSGTGTVRTVNRSALVPDESLTIDEGAVAPWNSLMWSLMTDVCRAMGIRTDIPFKDLTDEEKDIVYNGPAVKKQILYKAKKSNQAGELDFTYYNAVYTVENALSKVKDEAGMKRVSKFLVESVCPDCGGTRLNEKARSTTVCGKTLPQASAMTLTDLIAWVKSVPAQMPQALQPMAESIVKEFLSVSDRLMDLGLGYLTLDRTANTLSTGELQRIQLARAVRNKTTGVLYILDEPSIGLHPANVDGLLAVINDLVARGNSVVVVDHDTRVIKAADYVIEMGVGAGYSGGNVIAQGSVEDIENNSQSVIGAYLSEKVNVNVRNRADKSAMFDKGTIDLSTSPIHTVHALDVKIPKGRLTVVTGVSGSGKTTLILESLVPALQAKTNGGKMPDHVKDLQADGIHRVNLIDATPIGINVRSTVATYSGILDDLRKLYAATDSAKELKLKVNDFSYNTGSLRCPTCDGTGQISMDVQFLPDVEIVCPDCGGKRYSAEADKIKLTLNGTQFCIADLMSVTVDEAVKLFGAHKKIREKLETLSDLGLGYLMLGESTPALSGGEAQRLKLAAEMGKAQDDAVFVFDEPTIGLHPKDVSVLLNVFGRLLESGATVIVIEHDLDMINNADYIIDMGPLGGKECGKVIATGTPDDIASNQNSITGRYLKNKN